MKMLRVFRCGSFDYQAIFSRHIAELRTLKSRESLLNRALESLRTIFDVDDACILLKEDKLYVLKATRGTVQAHVNLPADAPLVHYLIHGDAPLGRDELADSRFELDRAFLLKDFVNLKAAILLPLIIDGDLLGIIALGTPAGRPSFNHEEKELLALFTYEIAIAIQNVSLHERLLKQERKLQELSNLKNTFIANMTHELTTPLHHMIGLAQALADGGDGEVNAEQHQHLETIARAGEHLLALHRTVLDLSRLEIKCEKNEHSSDYGRAPAVAGGRGCSEEHGRRR